MGNVNRKANAVGNEYTLKRLALALDDVKHALLFHDFDDLTVEREDSDRTLRERLSYFR